MTNYAILYMDGAVQNVLAINAETAISLCSRPVRIKGICAITSPYRSV